MGLHRFTRPTNGFSKNGRSTGPLLRLVRVLQLLPCAQEPAHYACDGSRNCGPRLERARTAGGSVSGILQEATPGLIAMRNVLIRIAVWASAGFLISLGWGFYFANTNKDIPIEPNVHTLAGLMQPIVVV